MQGLRSAAAALGTTGGRARLFALLAVLCLAVAVAGYVVTPTEPRVAVQTESPRSNTLVGVQGYQDDGRAIEVTPDGEVVWEYDAPDDVFDVEAVNDSTIQVSTATTVPDAECPDPYATDGYDGCVRNALQHVDQETNEVVWEYAWYDVEKHEHELHDADRYVVDGQSRYVLVDMGNDRVFAVDNAGETLWEWNATDDYERPDGMGPEGDWTHVNDVDRIEPGVFQISLRNFDTVAELHVEDGDVRVEPVVGPNAYHADEAGPLYEQHNPDRLGDDSLLVADSEHDRIVEFGPNGSVTWTAGGSDVFDWPRDGDRLSNGHTLVTDSYNDRVVEVDEQGTVVWEVQLRTLPYEADRIEPSEPSASDGSDAGPSAVESEFSTAVDDATVVERWTKFAVSIAKYVLPNRIAEQLFPLVGALVFLLLAGVERYRATRSA
ncbi:hypothetical protein [Haloarchaeobius sp. HRN-SO-5]|uniref:hypothetical protein n=1 Tax=Haloarchaeobius sp. HRN-SO-5 TaxID=3446118 RepID=UPI003EBB789A